MSFRAKEELFKCAMTSLSTKTQSMKYLKIDMRREEYIACVRVHLRMGLEEQIHQNGLTIRVSYTSYVRSATPCSNKVYNARSDGQSPVFVCLKQARFIWVVMENSLQPLQVCEVQAYGGM